MFIFDFVAETILDQILDWIYGKIIGFLNDFFVMMNNMGVELFELPWVEAVTTFFSYFGWALFGVGLVVGAFECTIEYQGGRGSIKDTAMNYIKGFMAVSLFTVVPVNLYSLCVSLQGTFGSAITGITDAGSIGLTAQQVLMSASFPGVGNPILQIFCAIMMGYAVIKVFFANLKRGGILLIQIAVGSLYMFSVPRGYIDGLKDFFRTYKNFTDSQIDTIEIMLGKLYEKWNIRDDTDFSKLSPTDYPILSDLYDLMEEEYKNYDAKKKELYTAELLQEICLGLHSMCKGAESKFFNGHTNITDSSFLTFGVKGLLQASRNVKDAMLFNILSYMSNELLTNGHTAASIDEFYLFLTNLTAVEYIRNFMKRVRKKDSAVILASQNLEDFNIDGIREYTKPLFSIPTHAFLFNAGNIDAKFYIDTLQLEKSEYNLIRYPQRGVCLYKCGNERYNLMVHAPEYKEKLFGSAGGR